MLKSRSPILLPLLTSFLFAGSFIAGKLTTIEISPLMTTLLRYLTAVVFLTGLVMLHYGRAALKVDRRDAGWLMLLGLFGVVGYHYFFFLSLRHTEVANTAIINACNPVITAVASSIVLQEKLRTRQYLGGLLSFFGVLLLLSKGDLFSLLSLQLNLGDLFMLCAVLCWVIYSLLLKRLSSRYSGFTLTYYAAFFGVLLLLGLVLTETSGTIATISQTGLWAIAYMGIGASGIGYLLYNLSVVKIGPTQTASSVYSLVPICVAVLALFFFQERITSIMWLSTGLIVSGLNLMLRSSKKVAAIAD